MAKKLRLIIFIALFFSLGACARPVGDFGRAKTNIVHDEIMPSLGSSRAKANIEPVSNFNQSDEEKEMQNRVWRFLIAPHTKDWFYDIVVEWQRTRLIAPKDQEFSIDRYYSYLRSQKFSSSRVRYNALLQDISIDIKTTPNVFLAICAVREIDRRRNIAVNSLASAGQIEKSSVINRKAENDLYISWFIRALTYRYQSYSLALERLLIETPHEEARNVDRRLSEMIIDVERAQRQDFCGSSLNYLQANNKSNISSRFQTQPFGATPIYKK